MNIPRKTTGLILTLAALLPLHAAAAEPAPSHVEVARAAVKAFGEALKGELMAAMQSGGPAAAIEVCKVRAPAIAEEVALAEDVDVYRVSLKNRNPENAPNAWQREVLLQFEERRAAGEDSASLVWQETAETPSGPEFRYMQAIPTGGLCLACHGETLDPSVAQKIVELYPRDKATGFREGDIRGAFVTIGQY